MTTVKNASDPVNIGNGSVSRSAMTDFGTKDGRRQKNFFRRKKMPSGLEQKVLVDRRGRADWAAKQKRLAIDDYSCVTCGKDHGLHVHHIIPQRSGGKGTIDNLVTLCAKCHSNVENERLEVIPIFMPLPEPDREDFTFEILPEKKGKKVKCPKKYGKRSFTSKGRKECKQCHRYFNAKIISQNFCRPTCRKKFWKTEMAEAYRLLLEKQRSTR